ncbi:hypothetical protein [uncultured Flavobacterium sp.]|uniref:hypothetical protein n=1 Tax=uncultured Flavobacterium sp. TaxID=165435 RepID=UPI0030813969
MVIELFFFALYFFIFFTAKVFYRKVYFLPQSARRFFSCIAFSKHKVRKALSISALWLLLSLSYRKLREDFYPVSRLANTKFAKLYQLKALWLLLSLSYRKVREDFYPVSRLANTKFAKLYQHKALRTLHLYKTFYKENLCALCGKKTYFS